MRNRYVWKILIRGRTLWSRVKLTLCSHTNINVLGLAIKCHVCGNGSGFCSSKTDLGTVTDCQPQFDSCIYSTQSVDGAGSGSQSSVTIRQCFVGYRPDAKEPYCDETVIESVKIVNISLIYISVAFFKYRVAYNQQRSNVFAIRIIVIRMILRVNVRNLWNVGSVQIFLLDLNVRTIKITAKTTSVQLKDCLVSIRNTVNHSFLTFFNLTNFISIFLFHRKWRCLQRLHHRIWTRNVFWRLKIREMLV